jgi:hypothetical protein
VPAGWAVPTQYVVNKAAIDRAIDTMHPVDPISYKPALAAAYNVLQHTNAAPASRAVGSHLSAGSSASMAPNNNRPPKCR